MLKFKFRLGHYIPSERGLLILAVLFFSMTFLPSCAQQERWTFQTESGKLVVEKVAEGITIPFGMVFLPDQRLLVTDRTSGKIWIVDVETGTKKSVGGVPPVHGKDQGGLLDIVLHPNYEQNGWLYFAYSAIEGTTNGTVVERAKLQGENLVSRQRIFTSIPFYSNGAHFGCRLLFHKGYLFLSIGERYSLRDSAQSLSNHLGKLLRVNDDGSVPADNPFSQTPGARPEIWSYGHRNPQGLAADPVADILYESEHGPRGGDELNIIRPGSNYGWPVITYGVEYSGATIGDGITAKQGMEQPAKYYKPSIAPSGLLFYSGEAFPSWKGNLFTGALALTHLNRLVLSKGRVVHEERLFKSKNWRVRSVLQGPRGFIYMGVDGGMILRIRPAE